MKMVVIMGFSVVLFFATLSIFPRHAQIIYHVFILLFGCEFFVYGTIKTMFWLDRKRKGEEG